MLRPIRDVENLKPGDRVYLETLKGSEKYEGVLLRTNKSSTVRGAFTLHVGSGYTFMVLQKLDETQRYNGDKWRLVRATREVPDVVPGTCGDADFGEQGCPVQRIHPVPNNNPFEDEPYVWMVLQNGALMTESDVVDFRPDPTRTTQWTDNNVPFDNVAKKNV